MFQRASLEHNRLHEAEALSYRKEIEKEFDIDTAELVEIAYRNRVEKDE